MRNTIWNAVRSKVPEGMILPWWALTARAVLFPLDFLFWRMSQTRGYQWQNDTWLIDGVRRGSYCRPSRQRCRNSRAWLLSPN